MELPVLKHRYTYYDHVDKLYPVIDYFCVSSQKSKTKLKDTCQSI